MGLKNGIILHLKLCLERLVDNNVVEKSIKNKDENSIPKLIKDMPEDIFDADETALFFKALPNITISYKNIFELST